MFPRLTLIRPIRLFLTLVLVSIITLIFYQPSLTLPLPHIQLPSDASSKVAPSPSVNPPISSNPWSQYAYVQYATNSIYLCNSLMFFASLANYSSQASRVLLYPHQMMSPTAKSGSGWGSNVKFLQEARDKYNVTLVPITVQHRVTADTTWGDSYTKLLAFGQTKYKRILVVDSDSLIFDSLDELFNEPESTINMPKAYWLRPEQDVFSSQLMLITPSADEMARVQQAIDQAADNEYDMEIVNSLYGDMAGVLPHKRYDMLSREFGSQDHSNYLGGDEWDAEKVFSEVKMVHFSDWPVPKPWMVTPNVVKAKAQPECPNSGDDECVERRLWEGLYKEFRRRRQEICGIVVVD